MGVIRGGRVSEGVQREDRRYTARGYYDFATHTGAIATYDLVDEAGRVVYLPDNFVIERTTVELVTALTSSGSATVALGTSQSGKGAVALAATAFDNAVFTADAAAAAAALPAKVDGAAIKATATVAGAALTAGKFAVTYSGFIGD